MNKTDYWPIAMAAAQSHVQEARQDWRAGNYWGATANLWSCSNRCRECLLEDAPIIIQETLAAMMARDDEAVDHWCNELSEYMKQMPYGIGR